MNIKLFRGKDGLLLDYSDLYYATASKQEFSSLVEFRKSFIEKQTICYSEVLNLPLTPHTFCEIRSGIIYGVENSVMSVFEEDILSASILADEWNSKCIIAELNDMYIGYLWETSV